MDHIGGVPVGLAGLLREAVVSLGPDGNVEWANDAAATLLRLDLADLVGTNALDRVHPDEVARALDGIVFSTTHPDRTAVVPFRLRGGDGSWVDVELMSSAVTTADGDHLVLVLRDATPRRALAEALALVAAGGPIEDTARWLARVIEARWPATIAAVLLEDRDGRRLLGTDQWPDDLRHALLEGPGVEGLWATAVATGEVTVLSDDAVPEPVRSIARADGFTTFAAAPVTDPAGDTAALVAWFDLAAAASMEFGHASDELRELLTLALERQNHLTRLDHAVRHDELTGLLNRSGFVELVERLGLELAADARAAAGDGRPTTRRAALLYMDLDGFKPVNDRHGHGVGDAVLRVVAGRLASLAGSWAVARIGGDEFVLLGDGGHDLTDDATALAQAAVAALVEPIEVTTPDGDLVEVHIGASVGVAVTEADGDVAGLLELADGAMYSVKAAGGRSWSARLPG